MHVLTYASSLHRSDPYCIIHWGDEEVFTSSIGMKNKETIGATRYDWKDQMASIVLTSNDESMNTKLKLSLYDTEIYGQGEFLGFVELDFVSLLGLHGGSFEFSLKPRDLSQRYIKGSITFYLKFHVPIWDSITMDTPSILRRRIVILSCSELPEVNGSAPNTKCIVTINGIPEFTSDVVDNSSTPSFPQSSLDLFLKSPTDDMEVIFYLYHVDHQRKKDICIGQANMPSEMVLNPTKTPWTLVLAPPRKAPPKKYNLHLPSGAIKVDVKMTNDHTNFQRQSFLSREHFTEDNRITECASSIKVLRSCVEVSNGVHLEEGTLQRYELERFGTVLGLKTVRELCADRKWILIPIHNTGVNVRDGDLSWALGSRYVIAVERDANKIATGDISMVESIHQDIQYTINSLRKKTLFSRLKYLSFKELKDDVSNALMNGCDQKRVFDIVASSIMLCLPGCRVLIGQEKGDLVEIFLYESFAFVDSFVIHKEYLIESVCLGRESKSHFLMNLDDLDVSRVLCFYRRRFSNQNFIRFAAPIKSGDLGFGFVSIQDVEVYIGGVRRKFRESNLLPWMQNIASFVGDQLYSGKEKEIISSLEQFILQGNANMEGLFQKVMDCCSDFFQSCKLIEVWAIDENLTIKSLCAKSNSSSLPVGREVLLRNIRVKIHTSNIVSSEKSLNRENDDNLEVTPSNLSKDRYILGIQYEGVEFCRLLEHDGLELNVLCASNFSMIIRNERNLHLTIYKMDQKMNILSEDYGNFQLNPSDERSIHCTMSERKSLTTTFDFRCDVSWMSSKEGNHVSKYEENFQNMGGIEIKIKKITELRVSDVDSASLFVEMYWCYGTDTLQHTKKLRKPKLMTTSSLTELVSLGRDVKLNAKLPIDAFPLQVDSGIALELWVKGLIGKGVFLGQVKLDLNHLSHSPTTEMIIPLITKSDMKAIHQTKVGGFLCIDYDVIKKTTVNTTSLSSTGVLNATVPKLIGDMMRPILKLTVVKASDLPKADTVGSSDPIVLIFIGIT